MAIDRRRAMALLGGASLMVLPRVAFSEDEGFRAEYLSANAANDGSFRIAGLTAGGDRVFELTLPGRGHGFTMHPRRREAVGFARRPGRFAIVFDPADGTERARLQSPRDRHFYGHGVFSRDGRYLYSSENDFDGERGVIGIWDAADCYQRVGEWASLGIGPHDLVLSPDGRALIVANGGILTHPDTGRRALNIPTMTPSLAYIDASNGTLVARYGVDTARHRLLSIRHLAVNARGVVCIGLQDHGPHGDLVPLVAFHGPGEPALDFREMPRGLSRRLRGYMGAVAMSADGQFAAVSAPRGGAVTFWDVRRRDYLTSIDLRDGCGVAQAANVAGGFLATSGAGGAVRVSPDTGRAVRIGGSFLLSRRWDNHLVTVALDD